MCETLRLSALYQMRNFSRKHADLEWLCKHVHAFFEMAVSDDGVLGIAGDENDFEVWAQLPGRISDLMSIMPPADRCP